MVNGSDAWYNVDSNVDMYYGGGGSGPARARQHSGFDWDDEW